MTAAQQGQRNYISFHLLCQTWLQNGKSILPYEKKKKSLCQEVEKVSVLHFLLQKN